MTLNVLYQSDDNYAPQTGVSITSLFENNRDIDDLNVYILNDGISSDNLDRFARLAKEYGRSVICVDASDIKKKLISLGVEPYKGSYTTYFKLLAFAHLPVGNADRILQIDGDTIINGSLAELISLDLDSAAFSATYDCIQNGYKRLIGLKPEDPYFNCGVLLINLRYWLENRCEEKIINHLRTVRSRYFTVDQDILNVLFRSNVKPLNIKYNLNSGFYLYGIENSFYIYDLNPDVFATPKQIESALCGPIINHCMGPMTGRPWEKGNRHPQRQLYDRYLALSPWSDVPKVVKKKSIMSRVQYGLYRILPMSLYRVVHKMILKKWLYDQDRRCRVAA